MRPKNSVHPIVLTSIDSADFTGDLQAVNPAGLDEACFLLRMTNDSNRDIRISGDGTTDHEYLFSGETLENYAYSNTDDRSSFQKGGVIYVRGAPGGTGLIYLSGYYKYRGA